MKKEKYIFVLVGAMLEVMCIFNISTVVSDSDNMHAAVEVKTSQAVTCSNSVYLFWKIYT